MSVDGFGDLVVFSVLIALALGALVLALAYDVFLSSPPGARRDEIFAEAVRAAVPIPFYLVGTSIGFWVGQTALPVPPVPMLTALAGLATFGWIGVRLRFQLASPLTRLVIR